MIIEKAVCRKCGEVTNIIDPSHNYLYHGMTFVCEHCRVTNCIIMRNGTVAVPNAFRDAFDIDQLRPDSFENEQALTIRIVVRSKKLSHKVLKDALTAVYYFVGTNVVGYLHAIFRFHGSDQPEKDFNVMFEKEFDT